QDGLCYVGFAPRVGRMTATSLGLVAELAARYGSGRVSTTSEQKLIILDVPPGRVADLTAELDAADLSPNPSVFRRHTMACTGIEFCKLAIVETKALASNTIDELEKRVPDFDTPVSVDVNS